MEIPEGWMEERVVIANLAGSLIGIGSRRVCSDVHLERSNGPIPLPGRKSDIFRGTIGNYVK